MLQPLLIEIGVEELPAIPLLNELNHIEAKWTKILEDNALLGQFEFFYTPRRLVLLHDEFLVNQKDKEEELFGAPVAIAFDADGNPTNAALGFAKKCGVDLSEIGKAQKGGKEVLYFKKKVQGQKSADLLPKMIESFVKSLNFGKSMRWGSNSESFIRPIRWLGVTLGHTIVDMQLFGVPSTNTTYVHRQNSFDAKTYTDPKNFFDVLKQGDVNLFADDREKLVLEQFKVIEKEHSIQIEVDADLLAEIVAITEHPVALLGSFSEAFLELPPEVVVTSMREHQRYFPVYKEGTLTNAFIVVSNAVADDYSLIVEGNEKVLHARLSDGLFFYHNDLKRGLLNDGLEKVIYMKGLGNLAEKLDRESNIALKLFKQHKAQILDNLGVDENKANTLFKRIFEVSKADLMSEMVYEFTELQGLMGSYYAKAQNEDPFISKAIVEQYLPEGEESAMPSNIFSAIVALSVKIDALMGLFSINQIPTGSRDPFALRRAANGVIQIALDQNLPLSLDTLFTDHLEGYASFDIALLENFLIERLNAVYGVNTTIIKAVLASGEQNILEIDKKIKALTSVTQNSDFKELVAVFKRVANITKDMTPSFDSVVSADLLQDEAEKNLYTAYDAVVSKNYETYEEELSALTALAPKLAGFFDNVMVNANDEALKNNRKNLIGKIYLSFKQIADIKEITL